MSERSHGIAKADIAATLRSRGLDMRAAWVERELPDLLDTGENCAAMAPVDPARERDWTPTREGKNP